MISQRITWHDSWMLPCESPKTYTTNRMLFLCVNTCNGGNSSFVWSYCRDCHFLWDDKILSKVQNKLNFVYIYDLFLFYIGSSKYISGSVTETKHHVNKDFHFNHISVEYHFEIKYHFYIDRCISYFLATMKTTH